MLPGFCVDTFGFVMAVSPMDLKALSMTLEK